jgi:hypothetical protein
MTRGRLAFVLTLYRTRPCLMSQVRSNIDLYTTCNAAASMNFNSVAEPNVHYIVLNDYYEAHTTCSVHIDLSDEETIRVLCLSQAFCLRYIWNFANRFRPWIIDFGVSTGKDLSTRILSRAMPTV